MPKLPCVPGREAVKALERLGFVRLRQKGSHVVLRKGDRGCVVPLHDEICQGTLRGALKQAGVSEQDFRDAL
jgi:predicted RNA binding protein YcfA (HicA-like mRNA interferase family)